ncbi:hypothetical protein G9A89_017248 [Geosiphon pyriformis]|nr:hypothetical protein G9A89_017248 [Geosiphon pyriformis]
MNNINPFQISPKSAPTKIKLTTPTTTTITNLSPEKQLKAKQIWTQEELLHRAELRHFELQERQHQLNLEKDEKIKTIKLRFEETLSEIREAREISLKIEKHHKRLTKQHELRTSELDDERYMISIEEYFCEYPNTIKEAINAWKAGLKECDNFEWILENIQLVVSDMLKRVENECQELWGQSEFQKFVQEREKKLREEELAQQKKEEIE